MIQKSQSPAVVPFLRVSVIVHVPETGCGDVELPRQMSIVICFAPRAFVTCALLIWM